MMNLMFFVNFVAAQETACWPERTMDVLGDCLIVYTFKNESIAVGDPELDAADCAETTNDDNKSVTCLIAHRLK